jgi:hypothetical protein
MCWREVVVYWCFRGCLLSFFEFEIREREWRVAVKE